jgi:ectoine hydroxylase-related dioxygenase (phytanoyl-CoA dioxygenase family)
MIELRSIAFSGSENQNVAINHFLNKEGAIILRNVITESEALALKSALQMALKEDLEHYGDSYLFKGMVHALMGRGQPFTDLIEKKDLLSVFRAILGHGCIIHAYNSSSMPPNQTNYSRAIHVDCPRLIPGYITNLGITIALDPFTSKNGAMEIAPSLFNEFHSPSEEKFNAEKVILDNLNVGDAILFNARCWHRGGLNTTDQWRHAITMNICRVFMKQQFDFPELLGDDKIRKLSDSAKQFIGYYSRVPKNMGEFLLPPEKRLYRSGQE